MRCLHCTRSAASAAFFSLLTLVATGCGLSVVGELIAVPDGGAPEGQGGDDATVSIPGAMDSSIGTGSGSLGDRDGTSSNAAPPLTDAGSVPGDAGGPDAPGALEAGISSQGAMACPPANDASACDVAASICCTCPNCSVPFPTVCLPTFPGCVPGGVYAALTCGSAANCPSGAECCATFDATPKLVGSSCKPSCAVSDVKLCADGSECGGSRSCQVLTSIPGFSGCQ
jgi:hypothetical protein